MGHYAKAEICSIHANYNIIRQIWILVIRGNANMCIASGLARERKSFKAHQ
jgi:hypothetical protein